MHRTGRAEARSARKRALVRSFSAGRGRAGRFGPFRRLERRAASPAGGRLAYPNNAKPALRKRRLPACELPMGHWRTPGASAIFSGSAAPWPQGWRSRSGLAAWDGASAGSPSGRFSRTLRTMKVETTVFLSEVLLTALGTRAPDPQDRSELVEAALREYLPQLRKRDPSRDLEIINAHAAELNQEAEDVLSYQVMP
jgi:hypothetical protein